MTDRENVEGLLEAAGLTRRNDRISPREQFWESKELCVTIDEDLETAELWVSLQKLPHFLSPAVQTLTDDEKVFLEKTRQASHHYHELGYLGALMETATAVPRLLAIIDRLLNKEEAR